MSNMKKLMKYYGFKHDYNCFRAVWDERTDIVLVDLSKYDEGIISAPTSLADPVLGIAVDFYTGETLIDEQDGMLAVEWFYNTVDAASYYNALYDVA